QMNVAIDDVGGCGRWFRALGEPAVKRRYQREHSRNQRRLDEISPIDGSRVITIGEHNSLRSHGLFSREPVLAPSCLTSLSGFRPLVVHAWPAFVIARIHIGISEPAMERSRFWGARSSAARDRRKCGGLGRGEVGG